MQSVVAQSTTLVDAPLSVPAVRLVLAAALGLFLGLEREWSRRSAGIRTFSLVALVGAVFTLVATETAVGNVLVAVGAGFVVVQGVLLAVRGLIPSADRDSLSLTTGASLLVAYGVGVLVAAEYTLEGVTVAVVSSGLLLLKRELHSFAGELSRAELRSTTEFAVLAFVVYPLLPAGRQTVYGVPIEPRVAWLMVVTVAGIGGLNYVLIQRYDGRGVAVTGFLGGLVSSTAVVGTMLDHVRDREALTPVAVAGVLLADAAMALRNLGVVLAFTVAAERPPLVGAVLPLGALVLGAAAVALWTADWSEPLSVELSSPFSIRNAVAFGGAFLVVLAATELARTLFGTAGLYASAALSGLVTSAGATTSVVLLYRSGAVAGETAVTAVLLATGASVVVKAGLATAGPSRFSRGVAVYSVATLFVAAVGAVAAVV
ncbi:MgtC/SapB family protein [Halobaculum sp. MBLA0147]|uniref:MgtC/SapB family protein n=1 Tax=Halobaculum sp. MBLA0147 TaxID=3079934 RepID=UPI003525B254